jgi:cell division protein FtsL
VSRLNFFLAIVAVICALGVVTGQHRARKLFGEYEREQALARSLEIEWGQLQIELGTWATPARVERLAANRLQMHPPPPAKVQIITPETTLARANP